MKERFVAKSRFGIGGNDNNKDVVFPVPSVTSIEGPKGPTNLYYMQVVGEKEAIPYKCEAFLELLARSKRVKL